MKREELINRPRYMHMHLGRALPSTITQWADVKLAWERRVDRLQYQQCVCLELPLSLLQ